jgi:hypothetical protein
MKVGYSSMKVSENREYIESNRWKCNQSPSGAHHWIISGQRMTCKYCSCDKQLNTTASGSPKTETK